MQNKIFWNLHWEFVQIFYIKFLGWFKQVKLYYYPGEIFSILDAIDFEF